MTFQLQRGFDTKTAAEANAARRYRFGFVLSVARRTVLADVQ
jgi:hypothetical protein